MPSEQGRGLASGPPPCVGVCGVCVRGVRAGCAVRGVCAGCVCGVCGAVCVCGVCVRCVCGVCGAGFAVRGVCVCLVYSRLVDPR